MKFIIELIVTRSYASVTLLEGNTVTLSCIPSVIETVLSWTHNGTNVNEDKDTTFSPLNLNHNLILDNTDVDDSGQYTCSAVLDDEIVEQNINVTVVPGTYLCTYVAKIISISAYLTVYTYICSIGMLNGCI